MSVLCPSHHIFNLQFLLLYGYKMVERVTLRMMMERTNE